MKKLLALILSLALLTTAVSTVFAAEQTTYVATSAFSLKNGSTEWSFQKATIGQDDYENLEFIETGWFHDFYQNWANGSFPACSSNGRLLGAHAGAVCDPVLTFTVPRDGNLQIVSFRAYHDQEAGDGVNFQILKNDMVIFPENEDWYVSESIKFETQVPNIYLTAEKGDKIYLRINMRENQNNDGLYTDGYQIKYLSAPAYEKAVTREGVIVVDEKPIKEKEPIVVNFTDVNNHWGKDYIIPLAQEGIIKGKTATTFEPDSNITRAEFLTLALNVADIKATAGTSYADVDAGAWFAATIATAKELGLIDENMTADGNFYPDKNITREEMTSVIVKLYESEKSEADEGDVTVFSDNATFSDWATQSIGKAVALGVVTGNPDGTFNALGNATRAEAAVIFSRVLDIL